MSSSLHTWQTKDNKFIRFQSCTFVLLQGSHTFSFAFFQDFSRSKLRFSRKVVCGRNCFKGGGGERSCQKYSMLISYVFFKKFLDFPGRFHFFLFSRTFSGLRINVLIFKIFQVSQGAWEPCPKYLFINM